MSGDLADFKARLPIVSIIQRYVRLTRHGPIWKGLCPFHQEKTPSFTVTESRGTYHCFGCGAHGNGIDFVMGLEGLDFAQAVQRVAELTGVEAPASERPDPARAQARAREAGLGDVLEAANGFFRAALARPDGTVAAAYAAGRGLDAATVETFELGWAPAGRALLTQALHAKGVPLADLVEVGLTIVPEDGGAAFDRFRDRLMFPIRDGRGRLVGFGGRALKDGAGAKYLNSPEGMLFKKRELLYGADRLDRRAGRGRLHVVEGYLDVIALARRGLAAVAPLGTAVTGEQIERLWRLDEQPLVCLDGDEAGRRAAGKLAEHALALLRPGHSLAFVLLPPGEDPDSLLAAGGIERWRAATAAPVPLATMLWRHIGGDRLDAAPEERALLRQRLRSLVAGIADGDVRREYGREFRTWLGDVAPGRGERRGGGRPAPASSSRLKAGLGLESARALLAPLMHAPALLVLFEEDVAALRFEAPAFEQLKEALLDCLVSDAGLETDALAAHLHTTGLGDIARTVLAGTARVTLLDSSREEIEGMYRLQLERHHRRRSADAEKDLLARAWASGAADATRRCEGVDSLLNSRTGDPTVPE